MKISVRPCLDCYQQLFNAMKVSENPPSHIDQQLSKRIRVLVKKYLLHSLLFELALLHASESSAAKYVEFAVNVDTEDVNLVPPMSNSTRSEAPIMCWGVADSFG
jgi:hypothetical protein